MATIVQDTFTEASNTLLDAHTGETGATWTKHASGSASTMTILASTDRLYAGGNDAMYYASGVPSSAEYQVTAVFYVESVTTNGTFVCGRMATGASTFYGVRMTSTGLDLQRRVTGTFTQLGTYSTTWTVDQSYTVTLEITDATKKVYLDGVERISSTDNTITATGVVGFRASAGESGTTAYNIDSLLAEDLPSVLQLPSLVAAPLIPTQGE